MSIERTISLLFIFYFVISPIATQSTANSILLTNSSTKQDKTILKSDLLNNAIDVANVLIENAIPDNKSGLKWNYSGTSMSGFYFGYGYGAAGIGDFFLNLYNQTSNKTYLTMAIQAYDYIYSHGITNGTLYNTFFKEPGYIFWTKSETDPIVYPGFKYGNAGISNFFLNLYLTTQNDTYLNSAEQSLSIFPITAINAQTVDTSQKGIYWGYSFYDPTPIADIMYGNVGIASAFLNIYKVTHNVSYLNIATNSLVWVLSQSAITDNTTNGQRYFRYSPDPIYPYTYTGYLGGASGIGSIFLDYYAITKNDDYLLFATQIGNWLSANEKNGLWPTGGPDLITDDSYNAGQFTGYAAGSSGIGMFLLHLYNTTKNTKYLSDVKQIVTMFNQQTNSQSTGLGIPVKVQTKGQNSYQSDLKMGLAGDGLFYGLLYNFFGLNESLDFIQKSVEYLNSQKTSSGMVPGDLGLNNQSTTYYDLSYLEGLTGVGVFYLQAFNDLKSGTVFNSSVYYNVTSSSSPLVGFDVISILLIPVFVIIIKKRK